MILIFVIFLMLVVISIGFYIISFNFFMVDFGNLYYKLFQGEIINERNFSLTPMYANYYNTNGSGDNNFHCSSAPGVFEDDDCYFRGEYGFIPPGKKLEITYFRTTQDNGIIFNLTGQILSGIKLNLRDLNNNDSFQYTFLSGGTLSGLTLKENTNYLIELENLDKNWSQYFLTISHREGVKEFNVIDSQKAVVKKYFNTFLGKRPLLLKDVQYITGIALNGIGNSIEFLNIPNAYKSNTATIHFNAGGSDYGGNMILTDIQYIDTGINIYVNSGTSIREGCNKIIKGYYWNPLRGDVSRPMDSDTLKNIQTSLGIYTGLNITGGFYTNCKNYENFIYGEITYYFTDINSPFFILQTGREYDYTGNQIVSSELLTNSFELIQYDSKMSPIGIIVDSAFGLGFVGGSMDNSNTFKKLITQLNIGGSKIEYMIKNIDEEYINFTSTISGSAYKYIKDLSVPN